MATVAGNEAQVRTGPGALYVAPFGTPLPSHFDEDLNTAFRQIGFTASGNEVTPSQDRVDVRVAERLRAIRQIAGASSLVMGFTMLEVNAHNLALAIPGGTISTEAAATDTGSATTVFRFPKTAGTARYSIVWESDDGLERLVLAKCLVTASGALSHGAVDSADPTGVPVEAAVEENSNATLHGGDDAYYLWDPALVPATLA